jgi:hypothetical protein
MRSTVDRAVVVGLLADPHAIGDFGDHRAADRTMGADILAGGRRRARSRWRTGFRLAHPAERQIAERRESSGREAGALQEGTAIRTAL